MKVYFLTLTWNGLDKLTKLKTGLMLNFSKLKSSGYDPLWVIKDNGSKDNTVDTVKAWNDTIVYEVGHNRDNFAKGVNYLFDKVNPEDDSIVFLLNNDIQLNDSESLLNMIELLLSDSNVGIVGARLLFTGTNKLQHAGVVFDDKWRMPFHFREGEVTDEFAVKNREFQVVTAACYCFRAQDFRKAKGMDEKYNWAFEDVDLCLKMKYNLGKKNLYCGNTSMFHECSATLKKNPVHKMFMNSNVKYFRDKWLGTYEIDLPTYKKDKNYNIVL